MYGRFKLALKYLHYYLTAANGKGHGTHSPFVFEFITKLLNDKRHYPEYDSVETLRKRLQHDKSILSVRDFGAGSATGTNRQRSIASIARNVAKPRALGQLLFRMARHYQPNTLLELGTSLGITTAYLSLARPGARVVTMEGANEIAAVAQRNFEALQLYNIEIREGNFDETLAAVIEELPRIDFAFIDGNHRREPTGRYFQQMLPKLHNDSVLVFDDIHWSREMEDAWKSIREHAAVRCSIDLFFIGIVFFRQEFRDKQDFVIRL